MSRSRAGSAAAVALRVHPLRPEPRQGVRRVPGSAWRIDVRLTARVPLRRLGCATVVWFGGLSPYCRVLLHLSLACLWVGCTPWLCITAAGRVRTQAALLQEQAAAAQQATVMTGAIVRQYQIADGVCQAWQRASADTAAAAAEERIPPVALLVHELSEHRPDGVWLRRIEIDGSRMELQGGATGQATLDTYLQQLSRSPYLDSIRLTTCQQADDAGRAYEFAVVAQVKRG